MPSSLLYPGLLPTSTLQFSEPGFFFPWPPPPQVVPFTARVQLKIIPPRYLGLLFPPRSSLAFVPSATIPRGKHPYLPVPGTAVFPCLYPALTVYCHNGYHQLYPALTVHYHNFSSLHINRTHLLLMPLSLFSFCVPSFPRGAGFLFTVLHGRQPQNPQTPAGS